MFESEQRRAGTITRACIVPSEITNTMDLTNT